MANQYTKPYQQNLPHIQTQNSQHGPPRAFSPQSYQQSPPPMSPNMPAHPAKRQRMSPNPGSPYQQPYPMSPYSNSPYATSPPGGQFQQPQSPATIHPPQSFNQPQPYYNHNDMNSRPPQGSMLPPKVPYSKTADHAELERAPRGEMDPNTISDVLTGSGIDLRAEEDNLLQTFTNRTQGNSFNSQASGSTLSPHGSFNQWSQGAQGHGAFQGNGPLSQPVSQQQHEDELLRKHERATRAYSEAAAAPLSDPFLMAGLLRQKLATTAYQEGIQVNLEGLFDKIPNTPQNVTRTTATGSTGDSLGSIAKLQADSLLNQNAPFVDVLGLISLAAEDRIRSILEDSFTLAQGRQNTSHGVVPPGLVDLAVANGDARPTTAVPINISKTAWEAPDSAVSPMTVSANKQPPNAARLPTPPTDAPPTPQPTVAFTNHVANGLKRRVTDDYKYEEARIAKRQKRLQGSSAGTPAETPAPAPIAIPEKITKKERDRLNKIGQTDEVLHRKANETASMALGGKKKYAWMMGGGGGGGGSGASTPSRLNTAVGGNAAGAAAPVQPQVDRALLGTRRTFGGPVETGDTGKKIQARDLIHVLEHDGKERKTLTWILARLRNTEKDDEKKAVGVR